MLATDLVELTSARLKIYFGSRDSPLSSLENIMSLNGTDLSPTTEQGMRNIRRLWTLLVGTDGSLDDNIHRTSGLLYYATLKLGDTRPSIKLYIPVRFYVKSDKKVWDAVQTFLKEQGNEAYVADYSLMLQELL